MARDEYTGASPQVGSKRRIIGATLIFLAAATLGAVWMRSEPHRQKLAHDLSTYENIQIGEGRREVRYRLGGPSAVEDKQRYNSDSWAQFPPAEQGEPEPFGNLPRVPKGRSINNFPKWIHGLEGEYILTEFDLNGHVQRISCYRVFFFGGPFECPSLFGVKLGYDEEKVIKLLGPPDTSRLVDDDYKTLTWSSIGFEGKFFRGNLETITKFSPAMGPIGAWMKGF